MQNGNNKNYTYQKLWVFKFSSILPDGSPKPLAVTTPHHPTTTTTSYG